MPEQHQRSSSAASSVHLQEEPHAQMMAPHHDGQHQRFDLYPPPQPAASKSQQRWLAVDYVNVNQTLNKIQPESLKQLQSDTLKQFHSETLKTFQAESLKQFQPGDPMKQYQEEVLKQYQDDPSKGKVRKMVTDCSRARSEKLLLTLFKGKVRKNGLLTDCSRTW